LQESSILNVDLSATALASANSAPLITGGEIALDGDLHISNSGNALDIGTLTSDAQLQDNETITLIDTDTAITGDIASLSTDTDSIPDYLSVFGQISATDNTQYQLGVGLLVCRTVWLRRHPCSRHIHPRWRQAVYCQ
jgi:hypothetical protein